MYLPEADGTTFGFLKTCRICRASPTVEFSKWTPTGFVKYALCKSHEQVTRALMHQSLAQARLGERR